MKYFIVKTPYGYYNRTISKTRISYSANIVNAHKYFSRKLAEKRADKINGEVLEFTFEEWCNKFVKNT